MYEYIEKELHNWFVYLFVKMEARIGLLVFCLCVTITLLEVIGKTEATVTKKPIECNTSKECGFNQCCANDKVKGRKKRSTGFAGICKPYGQKESECAVKNQNANDDVFPGWCPCNDPFNCIGTGNIENPFGEKGKCGL
ncbi:uncharacterized protein LOC127712657 isoform X2 [Mytilus californianus]|uniref:uncharacterized protein LOC127712657 isoform X2 n=1 Tax=Mytilus californianus TaxID=6549 RepID=UPI002246CCBF|nr:uncharacterized protein LOC127712657 isoform X2 [Mytilus californianus]